ncbi:MAG: flippase-like domain-containing protein [Methanobacteriaceae archaeon]|jgi:uncharacterized protein (TIRG00374 family)
MEKRISQRKGILWILAILVLAAIVLIAGVDKVTAALALSDPLWLVGLSMLQFLTISLTTLAWHLVIRAAGKISFRDTLSINLTGSFIESVTPSSKLGGEAVKIHLLHRCANLDYQQLSTVTLVSTLLTLLPFLVFAGLCLIWGAVNRQNVFLSAVTFLSLVIFTGTIVWICHAETIHQEAVPWTVYRLVGKLRFAPLIRRAFAFLRQAGQKSRHLLSRRVRFVVLILNSIIWILYPIKVLLVTWMLGMEIEFVDVATATYIAYLVSILPLLPGGLGSFEVTMAFTFNSMGVSFGEGLAVALLARLVTFWLPLGLSTIAACLTALKMRSGHQQIYSLRTMKNMDKEERFTRYFPKQRLNMLLALVNGILNWIESLGAQSQRYGKWYRNIFYHRLVERELKSASLKPGAAVLHIGCGHLPMTALYLAEMGFQVVAIDYDPAAVRSARQIVRSRLLDKRITILEAEGSKIDCSPYDAVWVSLVVSDKQRVVAQALQTLRHGASVLYRNYQGPLTLLYPRLAPQDLGPKYEHRRVTHALGKETIIVWQKLKNFCTRL